ncbi:tRNA nucleotidyltransferase (CCA-adding enzyme) [Clostridium cavendishii DSM 21758]|uniref:tRNA nucleotidyltransferase (CCA-adding enzyme) n=1 Tax=Clostridium cavendishii DSM 21758 TaxID=1121302 RepID=A0A1M6EZ40_9CLOT|nr:CCA tRNA nucleotidyltransferase [Clostridium cavendishii]SHI90723.1 tRNA nucleotidyltransferase (CCA-adding enzyme) [Clostridium cavendishii DSM 21758]
MEFKINIPKQVEFIISTLDENSFEAFAVGGCVRDSILLKEPNDWDITTEAEPLKVKEIFESLGYKVVETGIKHGTVTVIVDDEHFEVTTYRLDGEYEDLRRPKEVSFTKSLEEDLKRRDFTINAMAYNDKVGLVDYFNGREDLKNKIIRTVGNPLERFGEDALRMMRAVRFSAQLDFEIDNNTKEAIKKLAPNLNFIAVERINQELNKILVSNGVAKIETLYELGLLEFIIPELIEGFTAQNNPHHIYDVFHHTIKTMENIDNNLDLRLTMLFHDIGKPRAKTTDEKGIDHFYKHQLISYDMANDILKRLKYDNKTIEKVGNLVKEHDNRVKNKKSIRKLLNRIGKENTLELLKVWKADMLSQNPEYLEEKLIWLKDTEKKLNEILVSDECVNIKDLKISGNDILNLGVKGKEVGIILNNLLDKVLEEPELNEPEKLLNLAKQMI